MRLVTFNVLHGRSLARLLTFPAHVPDRQLDHILARGRLPPVKSAEAPYVPLSDHRPLVVELQRE